MMACTDNDKVLKEGVLHRYEKTQSRFLKQENWKTKDYYAELHQHSATFKSLVCYLYSCKDQRKGSELKQTIEVTNPHQVSKSSAVGVEKHKYDNYICITPVTGSTVFLSFESKSERDDWHDTIVSALKSLQVPITADSEQDHSPPRQRSGTEPHQNLVKRRVSPPNPARGAASEPVGGSQGFGKVLDQLKGRAKTNTAIDVQSSEPAEINPCCVRSHVVAYYQDGSNMVYHPDKHYENVHFVQSENDWHREIKAKQDTMKLHNEVYNDFHKLTVIQSPQPSDDAPKWPRKQRQPSFTNTPIQEDISTAESNEHLYQNFMKKGRRSPVENDERYLTGPSLSSTGDFESLKSFRHPSPPPPSLPDRQRSRRVSMKNRPLPSVPGAGAKEDEAKLKPPVTKRPSNDYVTSPRRNEDRLPDRRPPLPPIKGEKLNNMQRSLRQEMMQQNGIPKTFRKSEVVGEKIALVECIDSLIVAGWEPNNQKLTNNLHIGDKLTMVNQQMLSSANFAQETMKLTAEDEVTLKLQRIPYGILVSIHKEQPGQTLGIEVRGNEITLIHQNGLAALQGNIRQQTPGIINSGLLCNYAITEINMRPVGLNATTQQVQEMLRNAGTDVSLILHPIDFIQVLREALADTDRRYSFS